MKKKDNLRIFAIFLLVIFIILATVFIIHIRNNTSAVTEAKAYLYDPIAKELVPLKINTSGSAELAARIIFDVFAGAFLASEISALIKSTIFLYI